MAISTTKLVETTIFSTTTVATKSKSCLHVRWRLFYMARWHRCIAPHDIKPRQLFSPFTIQWRWWSASWWWLRLTNLPHGFFISALFYSSFFLIMFSMFHLDKNLISMFQLCSTNGVSVIFTPTYFQVRDLITGVLRLEGKPKNGTYEWPTNHRSTPPSLAYASAIKTTLSDWHSRLGHSALSILQNIILNFNLPFSSKDFSNKPCSACSINKMHKLTFKFNSYFHSSTSYYFFGCMNLSFNFNRWF